MSGGDPSAVALLAEELAAVALDRVARRVVRAKSRVASPHGLPILTQSARQARGE